jgi:predicted nucleic acid-binding Zn ribbon protein
VRGFAAAISPATPLARVQEVWEQTVGGTVAQAARPTAERSGVLTITCSAAVWAQELSLMESELLARLNGALGEGVVRTLRCRTG